LGGSSRTKREVREHDRDPASTPPVYSRASTLGRRALLWSIVLALPAVLLGGTELALRASGFGHDLEPLFIRSPQQPDFLQANPRVVTRFFPNAAHAPSVSIETAFFAAKKPAASFRVVVQGESSAAGFPYGLGAALAGALDRRLEQAFPDREIEVISTAMAAVNSYALLDFADEIIAQEPDAVLIYVGHNEFLGILGIGSTMRLAATPNVTRAFLAVRDWRLFQLMSRLVTRGRPMPSTPPADTGDSLMARVAGERSISLRSDLFAVGVEQFETNLSRLLGKYHAVGIPVFVGTLVSNERDQVPLAVLAGGDTEAAGTAKTAYQAAQDADAAGQYAAARDGYAWARDLDPLRFRAPTVFNDVIRRVAGQEGATVVDVRGAFAAASDHGLVGDRLVLEHVHPNLDGYAILADAFYAALLDRELPGMPTVQVTPAEARVSMPVSEIDRLLGEYKILRIKSTWPFTHPARAMELPPPTSEAERLAQALFLERVSWPEAQDALRRHYQAIRDASGYAHVSSILADAFPFSGRPQFETAAALMSLKRPTEALRYARRAVALEPRNVNHLLVHAHSLLSTGRTDEGRAALQRVLELEPGNPTARQVLAQLAAE
jgi:tetratricopeptide (TPR) repeat protein